MVIKDFLRQYIDDPNNPVNSYNLGQQYYKEGQYASAMGYLLRTAEMTDDDNAAYLCLCYVSNLLYLQGNRLHSSNGCALHAISLIPERPEAWFLYARNLEVTKNWQECYAACNTALRICDLRHINLDIGYYGPWNFLFEKAVVGYHLGKSEECRELFKHLYFDIPTNPSFDGVIESNMEFLKIPNWKHVYYDKSMYDNLRYKFPGSDAIEKNYSQSFQDLFVLMVLDGRRQGRYLEVGSADPFFGSNTALLETQFGWRGVSIEIENHYAEMFKWQRKNPVICADATTLNYKEILDNANYGNEWDYLQLDCDPPHITYEILQRIPFDDYRFAVITYEHDSYIGKEGEKYRDLSRQYLQDKGYYLLCQNVSVDSKRPYEDWWIHPELVGPEVFSKINGQISPATKAEFIVLNSTLPPHPLTKYDNLSLHGN